MRAATMTFQFTHQNPPSTDNVKPASAPMEPHIPAQISPARIELPPSPPTLSEDGPVESLFRSQAPFGKDSFSSTSIHSPSLQLPYRPLPPSPSTPVPRSNSSLEALNMPPMQRAYSSPGIDSNGRFIAPSHVTPRRPSSPLSHSRRRSPMRAAFEEPHPTSWSGLNIEPNIPEHAELELGGPMTPEDTLGPMSTLPSYSHTFPKPRRRPTSPLHQSASAPSLNARSVSPHLSGTASPALMVKNYANEPYPMYTYSSASSIPSTPTSLRSRSPSISSLETIEDIPDAEEAARVEAEEARLRSEESDGSTDSRRRSLDLRASGLRSNKERKRWSVCGAERRADFSLEPIEE